MPIYLVLFLFFNVFEVAYGCWFLSRSYLRVKFFPYTSIIYINKHFTDWWIIKTKNFKIQEYLSLVFSSYKTFDGLSFLFTLSVAGISYSNKICLLVTFEFMENHVFVGWHSTHYCTYWFCIRTIFNCEYV